MERKPACSSGANSDARGGERAGRTGYMEKDLTSGSVLKNIFTFSLPYLLSYFLQTLYGMADLFIIGQFEGVASTTAVSIGSQVMHMITVILVGVAMGTTVCIGRSVGAGDKKQAAKVIGNTVTLFMVGSVVLAAALVGLVDPIVRLISTPEEAVAGTAGRPPPPLRLDCFSGTGYRSGQGTGLHLLRHERPHRWRHRHDGHRLRLPHHRCLHRRRLHHPQHLHQIPPLRYVPGRCLHGLRIASIPFLYTTTV